MLHAFMPPEILDKLPERIRTRREKALRAMQATKLFARSGFQTTPPEILSERQATCRACEWWDPTALKGTGRCKKCGCSTWAKLRMATERCPIGKWEAVQPPAPSEATRQPLAR